MGVASEAVGVALEDANHKELFTQVLYKWWQTFLVYMFLSLLSHSNCPPPSLSLSSDYLHVGVSDKVRGLGVEGNGGGGMEGGGGGWSGEGVGLGVGMEWYSLELSLCIGNVQCYISTQTEAERKIFQVIFETSQTASEKVERFIAT